MAAIEAKSLGPKLDINELFRNGKRKDTLSRFIESLITYLGVRDEVEWIKDDVLLDFLR